MTLIGLVGSLNIEGASGINVYYLNGVVKVCEYILVSIYEDN
jgi:hypothetical protein